MCECMVGVEVMEAVCEGMWVDVRCEERVCGKVQTIGAMEIMKERSDDYILLS